MEKENKIKKEGEPSISKVSIDFTQEGNTLGTTDEYESITINLEFQGVEEDGAFITIKTDGWSIDDMKDLNKLVDRVKGILK
jgi:hypothetical protein